ncbi:MAG: sulfurtransferase [Methanotrichaceae archaeon]|nr:sulfurtransferase [Methanotrichaceae archaeon]
MRNTYPYPSGESKIKWISTEWLSEHINDKDLMILDIQPNVHDYIMGHLPNAIYLNEGVLRSSVNGLPAMYVPPESIEPILSRCGLNPNVPVIVYSATGNYSKCTAGLGDGLEQTMMAYSLIRFGHNHVYILDGGLEKWKSEGHELTKIFPKWKLSTFKVDVRREFFIEYDEFKKIKDNDNVILFDARPFAVYEEGGLWIKKGHIPGAFSLPWRSLMTNENAKLLKSDAELKEIVGKFNITADKTLLIYCGTGREATNEFLFFKFYLGHDKVRIYEGSFTEWSYHPDNPSVIGKNPR